MDLHAAGSNRKLAGFFTQIQVVFYKNLLLYKSNKLGVVFELLFISLSAILFIIADNIFVVNHYGNSYPLEPVDVLDNSRNFFTFYKTATNVYYFPNNSFVEQLVKKSLADFPSELAFIPANHSYPEDFGKEWLASTLAFISFSANLTSFEGFRGPLSYTLFTPE